MSLVPTVASAVSTGTAALYGHLELAAAQSKDGVLNSIPTPITRIGRSGNLALGAWILGAVTGQPLIRAAADGLVSVAAYQLMRRPEAPKDDKDVEFRLTGLPPYQLGGPQRASRRDAELVDQYIRSQS